MACVIIFTTMVVTCTNLNPIYLLCTLLDSNIPELISTTDRSCSGEGIVYTNYFTCTTAMLHCVNSVYPHSDTSTTSGNGVVSATSGKSSLRGTCTNGV